MRTVESIPPVELVWRRVKGAELVRRPAHSVRLVEVSMANWPNEGPSNSSVATSPDSSTIRRFRG
jgi:hypothetical protein